MIDDHVRLSRTQRRIYDLVKLRPGILASCLAQLLWEDDPNGGPDSGIKCLHVHVYHLNKKLKPHGIVVRSPFGAGEDGYRIRPI